MYDITYSLWIESPPTWHDSSFPDRADAERLVLASELDTEHALADVQIYATKYMQSLPKEKPNNTIQSPSILDKNQTCYTQPQHIVQKPYL